MVIGHGMIGFRDGNGIRPLVFGKRVTDSGSEYMFASESVALAACGFDFIRDVAPGEAIFVTEDGQFYSQQCADNASYSPCIFEYVYFARPDATLNDVSVYRSRLRMGQNLAEKWKQKFPDKIPDIIIPAPSTANTNA
jgi:amidophosphoribosyltransferase